MARHRTENLKYGYNLIGYIDRDGDWYEYSVEEPPVEDVSSWSSETDIYCVVVDGKPAGYEVYPPRMHSVGPVARFDTLEDAKTCAMMVHHNSIL